MCEGLESAGAVSVTLEDAGDDPQLEPEPGATPLWPHVTVRALYEHPAGPEAARAALPAGPAVTNVRVRRIDDRDWLAASREDIVPIEIGALWIGPHWATPPPDRVVVRLEPGLAFGSGRHPTTRLCLEWLVRKFGHFAKRGRGDAQASACFASSIGSGKANASQGAQAYLPVRRAPWPRSTQPMPTKLAKQAEARADPRPQPRRGRICGLAAAPPEGVDVIDYGCGSGILAVAAAVLGARRVTAIDIDPQALRATAENARANAVSDRVSVVAAETATSAAVEPASLVVANILAGPLTALAPALADLTATGGDLVLSGILEAQAEDVAGAFRNAFDMRTGATSEGWVRLDGRRR